MKDKSEQRPSFMRFHAGTFVLLGFILAAVLLSRMEGGSKFPSPDGRHVATVSQDQSEMTTGLYSSASLQRSGDWFGPRWYLLSEGPEGAIRIEWLSNDKLSVTYKLFGEWKAPLPMNVDGVFVTFKHDDLGYSNKMVEMEWEENSPTNDLKR